MILVRLVFQAKWGQAQAIVDGFKQNAVLMRQIQGPNARARILTDLSGPFNTVVQEVEVESLAAWEHLRAAIFSNPEFQQVQASANQFFESGRIEFYTIETTFEPA